MDLRDALTPSQKETGRCEKRGCESLPTAARARSILEVIPLKGQSAGERLYIIAFQDRARVVAGTGKKRLEKQAKIGRVHGRWRAPSRKWTSPRAVAYADRRARNHARGIQIGELRNLSANEELQSTDEELETTKEELQSSNEELSTLNEELQNSNAESTRPTTTSSIS